jgi:hypothetical protein
MKMATPTMPKKKKVSLIPKRNKNRRWNGGEIE